MRQVKIGNDGFEASAIALGLMRIADLNQEKANQVVSTSIENEITFFDHADIYGAGESERIFGQAIKELQVPRDSIHVQSKAGIRRGGWYDFSTKHLIESVEGSLRRLQMDYLDVFLLHRPDILVEPEEVAEAFDALHNRGLVRHFGVSNHNPMQIELLKKAVRQPLVINQLQLSATHHPMFDAGVNVNRVNEGSVMRDGSVLDYSRIHDMTIQPWSPFQVGTMKRGIFIGNSDYEELNSVLNRLAEEKDAAVEAIAIAWLLRHPARMQPVIGSMNPERIQGIAKSASIALSREEWYEVYRASGSLIP